MRWRRNFDNCNDCPKQKIGPNATCCGRRRTGRDFPWPAIPATVKLRDIVETTMRCRSGKYTYLPGALDRILAHAPPAFYSVEAVVDYVQAAVMAEEIPINRPLLAGWFDWFEHAHEMV